MKIAPHHAWNLSPSEAIALQKKLAARIDVTKTVATPALIAGADVSHARFSPDFYAVVVVLRTNDWTVIEQQHAVGKSPFPYIPGLLSFREAPILLEAFAKVHNVPDVVLVDGIGYAHPRRIGIACHLGLLLNLPTIGCGKSRLTGTFREPGPRPGNRSQLRDKGEVIGTVLRTKERSNPLFISPGHRIDLASSVRIVLKSCRGYRIPEPTRLAHQFVNEIRRLNT